MKTSIRITPLLAGNVFKIQEFQDYHEVIVTTSEGKDSVTMSFPWHKSIPETDEVLRRATKECVDRTQESLLQFLNNKKVKRDDPWLLRVLKREFEYLAKMCGKQ
jgi:hypothetical protein